MSPKIIIYTPYRSNSTNINILIYLRLYSDLLSLLLLYYLQLKIVNNMYTYIYI